MSVLQVLFSGNLTSADKLNILIPHIIAVLICIFVILPLHELAHAFTAHCLGDKSQKLMGRLTFNPLVSINPLGALFLLLFGIGFARPVIIDERNFKHPRAYTAITALAGPMMNFVCALLGGFIFYAMIAIFGLRAPTFIYNLIETFIRINVGIAVFNMIPLPPLDGSRVLGAFLPNRIREMYYRYQFVIMLAFMMLMLTGVLSTPLYYIIQWLMNIISYITSLPFLWAFTI